MRTASDFSSGAVALRRLPDLQAESVLRSILQSIDHGVLLTDLDHRSLACNRRFGEIFQVDPQEAVECEAEELRQMVAHLLADEAGWRANLETVYADPTARFEDEILFRHGPVLAIRRVATPVYNHDGTILGRLWTFTDVTEALRRRRNTDLLRQISTLANPDPSANLKAICEAVTGHFGGATQLNILEGDFLRFHFNAGDLGPAQHLPGIMRWDTYCGYTLADGAPLLVQDALRDPRCANLLPASVGFCRYLGVPVRDEKGRAVGTLCIIDQRTDEPLDETDVELMEMVAMRANAELSREKHLAERLAERERVYAQERQEIEETRLALAGLNQIFALLFDEADTDELLRRMVTTLHGLMGYDSVALLLKRAGDAEYEGVVWADDAAPAVSGGIGDLVLEGEPTAEVVFRRVDQAPLRRLLGLPWAMLARLPDGAGGEALVALGRAEEPPRESAGHLVRLGALMDGLRVVLAAHSLDSALKEAQEKALRSEKLAVVGTLAASTAHDIRNITASLSMLAADQGDPADALKAVREQLDRFNVLAHRLLSYARPGQTHPHPVDMGELLERVVGLIAGQCRVSRVEAVLDLAPDLPPVMGDEHQLQDVFVNLALNAVQAMERTGGSLRIEACPEEGKLAIRVADDGPGIPESVAGRLFQPFASSRAQGFGLGLFSAKRIVEAHGGSISTERNGDRGTIFLVELPLGTQR